MPGMRREPGASLGSRWVPGGRPERWRSEPPYSTLGIFSSDSERHQRSGKPASSVSSSM